MHLWHSSDQSRRMDFAASTWHHLCISWLVLNAVVTADVSANSTDATSTILPTTNATFITAITPLGPPGYVVLNERSTTSFSVTWTDVTADVTYYVTVSFLDGTVDEVVQNTTSPTIITGKTPGQTYAVVVAAVRGLEREDSNPQNLTLSPSAVTNLSEVADGTNSTTVTAFWEKGVGIVTGYKVSCSHGTADPPNDLSAGRTSASCSGNISGIIVNVTVTAVSGANKSTPETVQIVADPNPVESLEEKSTTTESVIVKWHPPLVGLVDSYLVWCSPNTWIWISASTTQLECNAIAGEIIVVSVWSSSNSKLSTPETVNITAVPNSVDALYEAGAATDSVTAGWIGPSAGIFDGYQFYCSSGTPNEDIPTEDIMQGTCNGIQAGQAVVVSVSSTSNNKTSVAKGISITSVPNPVDVMFEAGATTGNVTAGWIAPSVGNFDGYELSCSPGTPLEGNPSKSTIQGTCSTTEAGQVIVVSVSSTSDNRTSTVEYISITAFPDPVDDLHETDATTTSVTVGWVTPSGIVDSYTVECTGGTASPSASISNDSVEASCVNVLPGSKVTVTISSVSGNKSTPAEQPVWALPNAVNDLQESGATTGTVSVTWNRPMGKVDRYDVYCSADTTDNPDGTVSNEGYSLEYTCPAGTAGGEVNVTVVTVSGVKGNSRSGIVRALPNTVNNLRGSRATTSSVTVTWDRPVGEVEQYDIYCSADTTGNPDGSLFDGSSLEYSCPADTAGDEVTITVVTVSGGKVNSASTDVRALPNAVSNLREVSENTTSVTSAWEKTGGTVSYFIVECASGKPQEANVTDDGSSTDFTASCVDLETPGAEYIMTVTPFSYGISGASKTVRITAQPSKPTLSSTGATEDSITVEWEWNLTTDGEVDYFAVQCENGTTFESTLEYGRDDVTYRGSCTDLPVSGGLYSVTVHSVSNNKTSEVAEISVTAITVGVALTALEPTVSRVGASWPQLFERVDLFRVECSHGAEPVIDQIPHDERAVTYEAFCHGSVPGAPYNICVTTVWSGESASMSQIDLRASPESVVNFTVLDDYTTTQANLEWAVKGECEYGGCVWDRYLIAYSGSDTSGSGSRREDEVTVTLDNLVPGDLYNFTITVFSDDQESWIERTSQRMRPAEATGIVLSPDSRQITANWLRPDAGLVTDYLVSIRKTYSEDILDYQEVMGTTATFEGLAPGVSYTVRVCSRSVDQICMFGLLLATSTLEEPPSEPQEFMVGIVSNTDVIVEFSPPAAPNGIIISYTIAYVGILHGERDEGSSIVPANEQTESESGIYQTTIGDLKPGYTYNFQVYAFNTAGAGAAAVAVEQQLKETSLLTGIDFCPDSTTVITCNNEESVTWETPTSLSSEEFLVSSHSSGDLFQLGTTNVFYSVKAEQSGNAKVCDFRITVRKADSCPVTPYLYIAIVIASVTILVITFLLGILKIRHGKKATHSVDDRPAGDQGNQRRSLDDANDGDSNDQQAIAMAQNCTTTVGDEEYADTIYNTSESCTSLYQTIDESINYETVA